MANSVRFKWINFARERFPLSVYMTLSLGFVLSGAALGDGTGNIKAIFAALAGLLLFFAELRLMDEHKDYHKDVIAHPQRPIPRGLLSCKEVSNAIVFLFVLMMVYSFLVGVFFTQAAGAWCFLYTLYLWLMYKEFYIGTTLSEVPLLYAASHQIIILPLCIFTVAIHSPELALSTKVISYSIAVFGSFFCYEICRKLDPQAHPLLKTYLKVYGPYKTISAASLLILIASVGAYGLGAEKYLWPIEGITGLSLMLLFIRPQQFKIVEVMATLALASHIWSGPIQLIVRNLK